MQALSNLLMSRAVLGYDASAWPEKSVIPDHLEINVWAFGEELQVDDCNDGVAQIGCGAYLSCVEVRGRVIHAVRDVKADFHNQLLVEPVILLRSIGYYSPSDVPMAVLMHIIPDDVREHHGYGFGH